MTDLSGHSVVLYSGISSRKSAGGCGYCKSSGRYPNANDEDGDSSNDEVSDASNELRTVSFGMGTLQINTEHMNILMDRDWSRSGRYLYKPVNEKTCCPLYSIRLDVNNFRITRSQRRVLNLWHDYLLHDKRPIITSPITAKTPHKERKVKVATEEEDRPTRDPAKAGIKRKVTRRNRAIARMKKNGIDVKKYQEERILKEESRRKTLEKLLEYPVDDLKHAFEVRLLKVGSVEFNATVDESFLVYKKYQDLIHKDKADKDGFRAFLIDNPFVNAEPTHNDIYSEGSYHQQYLIDGKIVAVGVIDILPRCVSATYFYYDPDYKFLNFGTYSALNEIAFVRRISKAKAHCHYYYLGYYLHDCPKMNYKATFHPSELLCESSHHWLPAEECIAKINANSGKFTCFNPSVSAATGNPSEALILKQDNSSSSWKRVPASAMNQNHVQMYTKYVGPLCSQIYLLFQK